MQVQWASGRISRTLLLWVTLSVALAAYRALRSELTLICAAVLVGRIADGTVSVSTGVRIATTVVRARLIAATVAVLARLDYAVSALASSNGFDIAVVCKTVHVYKGSETRANVAQAAGRKCGHTCPRGRMHDVLTIRVAAGPGVGAADFTVGGHRTCLVAAVVHSTKGMPSLVSKDLPLGVGADDNVGRGDETGLAIRALVVGTLAAQLTSPSQTDG